MKVKIEIKGKNPFQVQEFFKIIKNRIRNLARKNNVEVSIERE